MVFLIFPNICKSQIVSEENYVTRKTCIEIFTGTWCGPCHFTSIDFRYNILPHIENYTIISYHQGPDVFATWEGHNRAEYYGLSCVLMHVFDGSIDTPSVSKFESYQLEKSHLKIDISNTFYVDSDSTIFVSGYVTPLKAYTEDFFTLRLIVTEKENTLHPNGWDTAYHYIAVKMSPSEFGKPMGTLHRNVPYYFNEAISVSGSHIQSIKNLQVVAMVQNDGTHNIEQSEWKDVTKSNGSDFPYFGEQDFNIFPNPANEFVCINNYTNINIKIFNSIGAEINLPIWIPSCDGLNFTIPFLFHLSKLKIFQMLRRTCR